jgi:uncharacterized protein (DUF58 family)
MEHRSLRALDDWFRGRFTIVGRAFVIGLVGSGLFLLGGISTGLSVSFGFLGGLLCMAWLASFFARPPAAAIRKIPPFAHAGEHWRYPVLVTNTGNQTLYQLMVEERGLAAFLRPLGEAVVIEKLEPGEQVEVWLRLDCQRRGEYQLAALQVSQSWPSGLIKATTILPAPDRVLVYPQFTRIEHTAVPVGKAHQPAGIPLASKIGESTEFHSLRHWREGDRVRDIHWPTFARLQKLVVREFQEEYFARLALVVDISAPKKSDEAAVEKALSRAAALVDVLARQDFLSEIMAAGTEVHRFQAGRALATMEHILELLACLEAGDALEAKVLEATLLEEASRLSGVIFVLTKLDSQRQGLVERIQKLGLVVQVETV